MQVIDPFIKGLNRPCYIVQPDKDFNVLTTSHLMLIIG